MKLHKYFLTFVLVISALMLSAQSVIYVDGDASGANNGSTWQDAYTNLSEAIEQAQSGDHLWVAAGIYVPTSQPNYDIGSSDQRFNHFTLKNGVSIIGGFAGDESSVDQRNLDANKTVLSGDIDQNDNLGENGYVTSYNDIVGENTYKLFYFPDNMNLDTTAVLDGFVLAGAKSENTVYPYNGGAAMLCLGASPKIINCGFYGNYAKDHGGAVWVKNSSIVIENCTFSGNYAGTHGGAFFYTESEINLKGCTFTNNNGSYGGAFSGYTNSSISVIEDCWFENNVASDNAGVFTTGGTPNILKNCTFKNNQAPWGGALVLYTNSSSEIINCTFEGNHAIDGDGGAIYAKTSNVNIYNSSFRGNEAYNNGGAIINVSGSDLTAYNTLFSGNVNGKRLVDDGTTNTGSAVYSRLSKVTLINSTLVSNYSYDNTNGAGVNNWDAEMTIQNSIIWNNRGAQQIRLSGSATVEVMNSTVQGGYTGSGNLDVYPLFLNPISPSTTPSTQGDFKLWGNSSANNKGINSYLPKDTYDLDNDGDTDEPISADLYGNERVFAGIVDMGCYEQQFASASGNMLSVYDNQQVDMGTNLTLNNTDFTIETWIFPRKDAANGSFHNICGNSDNGTANRPPTMYIFQYDRIHYGYGDGTNWNSGDTEKALKTGQWNHIAMTFNNINNTIKIYANGKLLEELTGVGEVSSTPLRYINSDQELRAYLDEFRVWKEERTQAELIANMNSTISGNEENLALYYSFDQVNSGEIEDQAGINNGTMVNTPGIFNSDAILTPILKPVENVGIDNFTISWFPVPDAFDYYIDVATDPEFKNLVKFGEPTNGATTYTVNGLSKGTVYYYKVTVRTNNDDWGRQYAHTATKLNPPGNALVLDGSTYVNANDVTKYEFSGTTIETWVKVDADQLNSRWALWACNPTDYLNNYVLFYGTAGEMFSLSQRDYDAGAWVEDEFDGSTLTADTWHHVALVIDKDNNFGKLYLDGVDKGSFVPVAHPYPYGSYFSIGQEFDNDAATSDFIKGSMDEFRIWSKPLSQAEIQANRYNTLTGNETDLVTYYNFDLQTGNKVIDNANVFDGQIIGNINWVESTVGLQDFVVEASSQTTSGFTLNWSAVAGATDYLVDVATDAQFTNQVISSAATNNDTTYDATGLEQGIKYYFRVATDQNDTSLTNYTNTLMEVPGNALVFDGKDDYVDISQITEMGNKNIVTMECWAYVDPTETHGRFLAINTATGGNKYLLSYQSDKGYQLYDANTGTVIGSNDFRKGTWMHLAVTMEAYGPASFYLNGKLIGTSNNGHPPLFSGNLISIGQEYDSDRKGDFLKGAIDEVRFWDRILSRDEIRANMHKKLAGNEEGLFAYYDFDQIEGQFLYEKVNGLDGTIISRPEWAQSDAIITPIWFGIDAIGYDYFEFGWWEVDGASEYKLQVATDPEFTNIVKERTVTERHQVVNNLEENTDYYFRLAAFNSRWSAWSTTQKISTLLIPPGNALDFNGVDGEVNVGYVMDNNWGAITLEAWAKLDPDQNGYPRIVGSYGDYAGFSLNLWQGSKRPYFEFWNANGTQNITNAWDTIMGPNSIADNIWHHIACTYDGTDMKLYLDGELINIKNNPGAVIKQATLKTGIGNQNGAAPLNGTLDEIRIWNVARTQEQINEMAHQSLTGNESGLVSYFNLDKADGTTFKDEAGNFDGTMTGGVTWAESKALITPFATGAKNIVNNGFTATWDSIPNATRYFLRVATDPLLTEPLEGWESVDMGNIDTFNVTGLTENTLYYYGVMSETDRLSAWSAASSVVKTTGGTSGELAANLSGDNNYIDLSAHISKFAGKNTGAITGWFKASEAGTILKMTGDGSNSAQLIVGDFYAPYKDESLWFICNTDGDNDPSFGIREGHNKYLDNKWHHFALIMGDGNNRFVIDGEEKEAFFFNGTAQSQEFTNISSPTNFTIGQDYSVMVDELAFYKNPITNEEVRERAHKKLTGDEVGLVAYYSFDNSSALDDSGLGRNGTLQGTASYLRANVLPTPFLNQPMPGVTVADLSWEPIEGASQYVIDVALDNLFQQKVLSNYVTTETNCRVESLDKNSKYFYRVKSKTDTVWSEFSGIGEFYTLPGNSLVLDGVDDYIQADNILSSGSQEATVECWVKVVGESQNAAIWAINSATGNENHYVFMYSRGNKTITLWENDPNMGPPSFGVELTDGWHHIAVSLRNGAESYIYVDGKERAAFTPSIDPLLQGYRFSIGQEYDNTDLASDYYKGEIDEFRVWNIALTQEEVRANMNLSEPEGANEHYIAHFTFDEIQTVEDGVHVFKDLAKQNDATLVGGATIKPSEGVINPITLEATDITPGSFTLHLNDIAWAQSYEIEIAHDNTFVPPLDMHENIGKVSSFNATNLCPGVKYFYRIRAIYDENNISAWSAVDTIRTIDSGASIGEFMATTGDYSGMLKLSWNCENSYLVSNFEIKRRIAGTEDDFKHLITLENNDLYFYTDTTAAPGTYYEYTIQGLSYCYDNDTEVVTSNMGFRLPKVTVGKDDGRIRLDWVYAENFAQNLEIVRKDIETGIEQVFQEVADSTHFNDSTMSLCVPYQYTLISKTKTFGDVNAQPVIYTLNEDIFDAIDTLDASKGYKDNRVVLNWISEKQSIIDEYHISRRRYSTGNNWETVKIIDKGTTQTWIDEEAIPGEYYEYCIIGIGSCGNNEIFTDSAISVGFRQPEGVLNGQVSYEGGNPVRDVRIVADYDNSDESYGSCLAFNGNGEIKLAPTYDHFSFENGATIEMWIKPQTTEQEATLFANSSSEFVLHSDGNIGATTGNGEISYNLITDEQQVWNSDWNHVAMALNDSAFSIYVNGQSVAYSPTTSVFVLDSINTIAENFNGTIDEFRLWNTYRNDSIIEHFHSLMLPREQEGLISALRFDENLGEYAFDHTRTESEPNKNHAKIINGTWSKNVPSTARLALGAISEPTGNYQVNGIWFKGSGETFSITPTFGVHSFNPSTRSMLISENSLIYNNQDFTDISAFRVTGNVKYYNAEFPVKGIMLYVDGQLAVDPEGAPIVTDEDGNFDIEVPIGEHFISVGKMGHIFSNGYFPPKNSEGEIQYHNFNDIVSGIQFVDSTFMTVAGRIVGGTVEGDKEVGFNNSINNLGVSSFTVESVKGYPIDETNETITVETDPESGEYEVKLFPEQYSFVQSGLTHIGNDMYEFNGIEDLALLDLTSAPLLTEVTDTVTNMTISDGDTTYTDTVYTYAYHHKRNWIYRSVPNIEVVNVNGEQFISDSIYYALDENQDTVALNLITESGDHAFNYPVFTKGKQYNTLIKVFEQYENADNNEIDRVPVNDGIVTVINGCGNYPAPVEFEIANGIVEYSFYGGFPNPTIDALNPELSYTKTFEVHAATGNGGAIQSQWPESEPYRAYAFGGIPTGNNFVTNGPDLVDFILRDPPGSNSHSYFEEGFTISNTQSSSFNNSMASSMGVEVDLGWKVTTFVGFGAGVIMENEQIANIETGVETETSYSGGHSYNSTKTFNQSYSTSDDPLYVGKGGDLFFGHATNISYGVSNFIKPIIPGTGEDEIDNEYNGFTIGLKKAVNFGLEYSTEFIYTQNHIENYLIPDLEAMADYHAGNGNTDSANHYIEQANHWRKVLGQNEYQKYVAKTIPHSEDKNISFDAGSIYEQSMTSEITETFTTEFEFGITASVASEVGLEIGGVGTTWSMSHETSSSETSGSENSTTESTTIGFVLEDGDQGDYFSVDILKDYFGNGPVFSTKGGQSSCPYESGSVVEYADYYTDGFLGGFANGIDLNSPTMRIEVPAITAENAIVSGVPDNQPAIFTLKLSNLSEVNADNWFILRVDAASNPYGAKLRMDGASIVNGVAILVPGGTTLTKTLEFEKGRSDIFNYQNVRLIMHSECQFDPTDDIEDIADTLRLTANFVPTCSNVAITNLTDNWLVNVENNDSLPIRISEYNLQHNTLEKIAFLYKPSSGTSWSTKAMFFHDTTDYGAYSGEKYKINDAEYVDYMWNMAALQDRGYQVRVASMCTDESVYESDPLTGTLDGIRPQVFGSPSPADGTLDPNDEIMITFNEPIEEGLVTPYNIDVEGVLNGTESNHGTALLFDGSTSYAETPSGINLNNKSFTIEFWAQKTPESTGTVISQGVNLQQSIAIEFTDTDIVAKINGVSYSTQNTKDDGQWHHWTLAYNKDNSLLQIFADSEILLEEECEPLEAFGPFNFGKNATSNANYLTGKVHDIRIWKRALTFTDMVETMSLQLTGNELGLFANWPMNEGEGEIIEEIVHSRHASNHATWVVSPAGSAYEFNGTDQALAFQTGSIPIIQEMDLTFEVWFKAAAQQGEAYLFSNGNPEAPGYSAESCFAVKLNSEGNIVIENNGTTLSADGNYANNQWHHLAFVINRRAYASLFINGEKISSTPAPAFGSMLSSYAFLGALGYIDNGQQHQITKLFNGIIDEVRIWKTARTQEQISIYKNTRLAGTEAGLVAYFPFETFEEEMGDVTSVATLEDMSIDPDSPTGENHCGELIPMGEETISQIAPNIKRKRPIQTVNYDYVINNDKIIITPNDDLALIEKCILEITVKNIQDKNGNKMASPATWTAFINKNQVYWDENYFEFEKDVNDTLSFTTKIVNSSGVVQPFTLSNIPSWLTASPISGTIQPNQDITVTFTVNEGINIGSYYEDIYLSASSGFNERLTLNLRVYKEAPDWHVDDDQYQSSMNIISQIKVQEVFSSDPYDMIGVFSGTQCRGVAHLEYKQNYDDYFAFLVVYGNTNGEELTYKFWDASEGKVFTDVVPVYAFEPNALYGSMADPILFNVGIQENNTIQLIDGWKWLSFNLDIDQPNINNVLSDLTPQPGDIIKHNNLFASFDATINRWEGSLNEFEIGKLYRLSYSSNETLNYQGAAISPTNYPITISEGWNRIGYTPSVNLTVNEALAGFEPQIDDVIKDQFEFAIFDGYEWIGSLNYMQPDAGYMYKSLNSETFTFTYPESGNMKSSAIFNSNTQLENGLIVTDFEYAMSVIARINVPFESGARLNAYIDNELVGEASIIDDDTNRGYSFITVYGNESVLQKDIVFRLQNKAETIDLQGKASFKGNFIEGTLEMPVELYPANTVGNIENRNYNSYQIYPNPFTEKLVVSIKLNKTQPVKVEIYNMVGKQLGIITDRVYPVGEQSILWDGKDGKGNTISAGVYFIHIQSELLDRIVKVVKK